MTTTKQKLSSHDQLFKDIIKAFFQEAIELLAKDAAEQLQFDQVEFLDKEMFTDIPEGKH